jgi:hypothetical protein
MLHLINIIISRIMTNPRTPYRVGMLISDIVLFFIKTNTGCWVNFGYDINARKWIITYLDFAVYPGQFYYASFLGVKELAAAIKDLEDDSKWEAALDSIYSEIK